MPMMYLASRGRHCCRGQRNKMKRTANLVPTMAPNLIADRHEHLLRTNAYFIACRVCISHTHTQFLRYLSLVMSCVARG